MVENFKKKIDFLKKLGRELFPDFDEVLEEIGKAIEDGREQEIWDKIEGGSEKAGTRDG